MTYNHHTKFISVALGQCIEAPAISIVERIMTRVNRPPNGRWVSSCRVNNYPKKFHIRHVERLDMDTQYSDILTRVKELYEAPTLSANNNIKAIAFDVTGLGLPVWEMLRGSKVAKYINGVSITETGDVTHEISVGGIKLTAPRVDIISSLQLAFQTGVILIADMPGSDMFAQDLESLNKDPDVSGNTGVALSVAIAVWLASQPRSVTNEGCLGGWHDDTFCLWHPDDNEVYL